MSNVKVKDLSNCLLDHQKKFYYVHIPKNAGSSIGEIFKVGLPPHNVANDFIQQHPTYFGWTTIRNSWDRLVSMYYYNKEIPKTHNFEQFVMDFVHPEGKCSQKGKECWQHYLGAHGQLYYCICYKTNLFCLDFYANTWYLKEHLNELFSILDIDKEKLSNIPKLNTTTHDDYRKLYTHDMIEACRIRYQEEINHFGFEFDDPKRTKEFVGKNLSSIKIGG